MAITLLCSMCHQPQFDCPSGMTCPEGHGGAPGYEPTGALSDAQQAELDDLLFVWWQVDVLDGAKPNIYQHSVMRHVRTMQAVKSFQGRTIHVFRTEEEVRRFRARMIERWTTQHIEAEVNTVRRSAGLPDVHHPPPLELKFVTLDADSEAELAGRVPGEPT